MLEHQALETKASDDLPGAFDAFMRTFEAFKETNDARLQELEKRCTADVLIEEKLARIDHALDEQKRIVDDVCRKAASAPEGEPGTALAHKAAFEAYVRKGDMGPLGNLEGKALSVGSEADGGYLVPEETERTINQALRSISPIRSIAGVRRISSMVLKRPFAISGADAGWVGETAARPQTGTPVLAELAFPTMELYAMPAATATLLDDAAVTIDSWLAEEVESAFAAQEGAAFVTGDGVNKPKGFLAYNAVPNGSWTWGSIGYIATGVAGDFPATDPADTLIDLVYALKSTYRSNARFVVNRLTQSAIRKLKDGAGNYLWQPSPVAGAAPMLMGFPVTEAEDMPDIAPSSLAVAFGDFRRGYLVVDRAGIRVLRDHYSAKPYVLFYTTKRVGGGVQDFDAIKLLKFAAS